MLYATSTPNFVSQYHVFPFTTIHPNQQSLLVRLLLVEDVGQVASATVLTVRHRGHEDTSATLYLNLSANLVLSLRNCARDKTYGVAGALSSETLDVTVLVNLVVLENSQLGLLSLVLDLLGGGVHLLLALLTTTTQAQHQVKGALLLDVVVAQGTAILELLTSKDESLLVGGNALLVLDLGLDIVDSIGRLHLKGDRLPREGLDENLHLA